MSVFAVIVAVLYFKAGSLKGSTKDGFNIMMARLSLGNLQGFTQTCYHSVNIKD
jgi:hypothetical protein